MSIKKDACLSHKLRDEIYKTSNDIYNFIQHFSYNIKYVDIRSNEKEDILLVFHLTRNVNNMSLIEDLSNTKYDSLYVCINDQYEHVSAKKYIYNYIGNISYPISGSTSMQSSYKSIKIINDNVLKILPKKDLIFCNIYPYMLNPENLENYEMIFFHMKILYDDFILTLDENGISYDKNKICRSKDEEKLINFIIESKNKLNLVITRGRSKTCKISNLLLQTAQRYLNSMIILTCDSNGLSNDLKDSNIKRIINLPTIFPDESFMESLIILEF